MEMELFPYDSPASKNFLSNAPDEVKVRYDLRVSSFGSSELGRNHYGNL